MLAQVALGTHPDEAMTAAHHAARLNDTPLNQLWWLLTRADVEGLSETMATQIAEAVKARPQESCAPLERWARGQHAPISPVVMQARQQCHALMRGAP